MAKKAETPKQTGPNVRKIVSAMRIASAETRVKVILALLEGEKYVNELCALIAITQPALSHHLAMMKVGGFIEGRRDQKRMYYSLTDLGRDFAAMAQRLSA